MAGRGAHGRNLKLDDICHPCLIETTFIWNYFKSTCRAHHLSSDSCPKRRLGFSWGPNLTPIFSRKRRSKKFGAILNALYSRDSRLFPLPIVPRALSVFRLLLFLLGYSAGASAKERGLDTSLISIDVFIAVHFSLAFVC